MRTKLQLLLPAILLTSCASGQWGDSRQGDCVAGYVDERRLAAELSSTPSCCSDFSSMVFVQAVLNGDAPYTLQKGAPVFSFPSGKSRFTAVQLPTGAKKFLLVRPYISGRTSIATSCADSRTAMFVGDGSEWYRAIEPVVTFLNEHKAPLSAAVPALAADDGDYRHEIPSGAVFAIIHTRPERYGTQRRIFPRRIDQNISPTGAISIYTPQTLAAVVTSTGGVTLAYAD